MRAAGLFVEHPNGTAKSDEIVTQTCPLCTHRHLPTTGSQVTCPTSFTANVAGWPG
jgi:hypothetical protein